MASPVGTFLGIFLLMSDEERILKKANTDLPPMTETGYPGNLVTEEFW